MGDTNDVFVNEDLNKPENRVNLALFSLMQQDWFREWIQNRLCLPADAVMYPPMNVHNRRPDFKVVSDGSELVAMIEVELGTDRSQAQDYQEKFGEVRTIWGRRESLGDLSLEEIAEFLEEPRCLSPQVRKNVEHLGKLIREGLCGHSTLVKRVTVSDEMRRHPLVVRLLDRLGDRLEATIDRVGNGRLKADTIGPKGFSLKVNRRDKSEEVALLSIRGGAHLYFPTRQKLSRCLPGRGAAVETYMNLVTELGCDVDVSGENARPSLPLDPNLDVLLGKVEELVRCFKALAG